MRGRGSSIAGNPVLIGAATVLVIIVAMFLSYNANAGLPFVPSYQLKLETPSAAALVRGNEVRIGGTRVGAVDEITTRRLENGTSVAVIGLKLERAVAPLPKDSTVIIRPKSALGLKYVEITRGKSDDGYEEGDTIPVSASTPTPVEFDEFVNMFDEATRPAMQENLRGFGDAFAGRGSSINAALGVLPALLRDIQPVARSLSDPDTQLKRFFDELGDTARIVAPAAEAQAELFRNLDVTFTALDRVARPFIQDSITEGRPTLDAAIRSFPLQRPFLRNSELLFEELQPGREGAGDRGSRSRRHVRERPVDAAQHARLQPPPDLAARGGPVVRERPGRAARSEEPCRDARGAQSDAAEPRAGPDAVQLHHPLVPQRLLAAQRGRRPRHVAALHHHRHAAGTEQRGPGLVGARQRRHADARQLPALEPVPEHGVARPDRRSARPATSRSSSAAR